MPRAVADTLGVKEHPGRTLTQSMVAALQSRPALLVLDNCEHVIDGAAALAHAIAQGCPMVRVLATSREALGIDDEQLLPVAPLDPAGPARRAVQRAGAGGLRDVRCGRRPRRRRGDLPSPGWHPAGHRVGRGPQQNPGPSRTWWPGSAIACAC